MQSSRIPLMRQTSFMVSPIGTVTDVGASSTTGPSSLRLETNSYSSSCSSCIGFMAADVSALANGSTDSPAACSGATALSDPNVSMETCSVAVVAIGTKTLHFDMPPWLEATTTYSPKSSSVALLISKV